MFCQHRLPITKRTGIKLNVLFRSLIRSTPIRIQLGQCLEFDLKFKVINILKVLPP